MKKLICVIMSLALLLTAAAVVAAAEGSTVNYDEAGAVDLAFEKILWNGNVFADSSSGQNVTDTLAAILNAKGQVDDRSGTGKTLGLEGWVDLGKEISEFGFVGGGETVFDAAFDKGAKSDHGEFAKQFSVTVDISKYVNDYEVGVCAKLADGTVVLLNSTAAPEKNTFIKFAGPMTEEYMFEEGDVDTNPVEVLFFDEETNYSYFFKGKNDIIDISYDEEKHCYTVVMEDAYDPYFELDFATLVSLEEIEQISADEAKVVSIGVRFNPEGRVDGTFYYQTSEHPGYSESQNIHYRYENKNDYQFIYIDLRDAENWTGDVANCRYDLLATCSGACDFEIYYIAFFKTMRGAKEFGEAWLERGGGANSGEAASENTPEPTDQPAEEATQEPATEPAAEPTTEPVAEPTTEPAAEPTTEPAAEPTEKPDDEAGKSGGKKGCGGTAVGILPVALLAAAASAGFVFKRKEN